MTNLNIPKEESKMIHCVSFNINPRKMMSFLKRLLQNIGGIGRIHVEDYI